MRIRLLGIIALLFIFPPLGAETYMIFREIYSVTGRTKSSSLTGRFGNPVGQRFASREAVETFASDRRQRLENMRFFQSVEISTDYGDALGDGTIPVMLEVHIVDGVAVFPLPMLFYNSNQGLTMGMYAMMPNFMGTLRSAGMGGSYQAYPDEQGKLAWADPNFFFMLMLQGIRLNEKMELSLFFMAGRPLVPVRVDEAIVYEYQTQTAVFKPGVTYRLSENLTNQMGMGLAGTYQPERTQENAPEYARYGPAKGTVSFSDTLEYRDVNWTGNFRDGFRTALTADYSLVFPHFAENYRQLQIKGEAAAYRVISPRLNPQVRFRLLYATGYPQLDLGRDIRGVLDSRLYGNAAVYLNSGIQMRLFRVGKAEIHLMPTLDAALRFLWSDIPPPAQSCDPVQTAFSAGGELMFINDRLKILPFKVGIAYDLSPDAGKTGTSRWEVDINFSLEF